MEKREPLCTVGGTVNRYRLCAKQYGISAKIKTYNITTMRSSNSIYISETETLKAFCTPMSAAALLPTAKARAQLQCPSMDKQTREMWHAHMHAHAHSWLLLSHNNCKEILPFATMWIGLEGIIPSEISQTGRHTLWSHLYVESETNKETKNQRTRTHRVRDQICGSQRLGELDEAGQKVHTSSYQ